MKYILNYQHEDDLIEEQGGEFMAVKPGVGYAQDSKNVFYNKTIRINIKATYQKRWDVEKTQTIDIPRYSSILKSTEFILTGDEVDEMSVWYADNIRPGEQYYGVKVYVKKTDIVEDNSDFDPSDNGDFACFTDYSSRRVGRKHGDIKLILSPDTEEIELELFGVSYY